MLTSQYFPDSFVGNGSIVAFPFTFRILAKTDLIAILQSTMTGAAVTLELGSDYTIPDTDVNTDDGGTVTLAIAPTAIQKVILYRNTSRAQLINLTEGSPFPSAVITKEFDRLHMIVQELDDSIEERKDLVESRVIVAPNAGSMTVIFDEPMASPYYNILFMTPSWQTTIAASHKTRDGFVMTFGVEAPGVGGTVVYGVSLLMPTVGTREASVLVAPNSMGVTIVFDTPMPNADYDVFFITPNWQTTSTWTDKTTAGFSIAFSVPSPPIGGTVVYGVGQAPFTDSAVGGGGGGGTGLDVSYFLNVKAFGALGDGVTDDTLAIQATINAAVGAGGGMVFFPVGHYKVTSSILVSSDNIVLAGGGNGSVIMPSGSTTFPAVKFSGSIGSVVSLGSNANFGDLSIAVTGGAGTGFAAGDYILITDNDAKAQTTQVVAKSTDTLFTSEPIMTETGFLTANGAKVQKVTMITGVGARQLAIDGNNNTGTDAQGLFSYCVAESAFSDLYVTGTTGAATYFDTGYNNKLLNFTLKDCGSSLQSDFECRRQGGHQVDNIQSYRASGFGPQFAFNSGGEVSNVSSISATGRAIKLQRNVRTDFTNIHALKASMTGLSVTVGSEGNKFVNVFASGNTLAGVWVQGDDGDKFNSFINVESIWNDARDVELGTGALDNTFTNVRVKLPVAASILDFGTRTTFINMMGHNGPGVFGFDSNSIVGPSLVLDRESLSPNTGDFLGTVIFSGRNGAAAVVQYSRIVGEISDIAGGAERGRLAVVTLELGAEAITALFEGPADGNTALSLRRNVGGSFAMSTVSMGDTDSGGSGYRLLRVPN